jgi:hypothetical protein
LHPESDIFVGRYGGHRRSIEDDHILATRFDFFASDQRLIERAAPEFLVHLGQFSRESNSTLAPASVRQV